MKTKKQLLENLIRRIVREERSMGESDEADIIIAGFDFDDKSEILRIIKTIGYGPIFKASDNRIKIKVDPDEISDAIDYLESKLSKFNVEIYEE